YLGLFQVTRRKGETIGGRYRRNGYVRGQQNPGRLPGRLRRQAGTPQTTQTKKPHENPKVLMRLFRFGGY
ncbi:hypothetical protein, partial [Pseudomonas sp. GM78]|uniref:hypothetical protein n=1 Tax=Pseudomonas sp. GM78 TaxID=1144337 RepID=UPI001EE68B7C